MPRQNLASVSSRVVAILAVAFLFAGCATPPEHDPEALAEFEDTNDPIEPFNRAVFDFNRTVDGLLFKPPAILYRGVVPGPAREGVHDEPGLRQWPPGPLSPILARERFGKGHRMTSARRARQSHAGVAG